MRAFLADVAYAARTLVKKPAFALTAIFTLALGIGASAAIFSVVNAVLLRPLPYADPERLVHVALDMRNRNVSDFPWSPADFYDLRTQTTTFDGVAGLVTGRQVFMTPGQNEPEQLRTGNATTNLFRVLGAKMALGNDFSDADGTPLPQPPPAPAGAPAAAPPPPIQRTIISHQYWQRRFGANPGVIGTVLHLGPASFEIIGVLEPGFELLLPPELNVETAPDIWNPLRVDFAAGSRINVFLRVIARLKDGATIEAARGEVDALAARLREQFPISKTAGVFMRVEPLREDLVHEVRPAIVALMGAVTFVLLIACANVANLLLIRAASRERELAVRSALGGTRWRIVRQLLAESCLLAGLATVFGLALAHAGIRLLLTLGPENLPRLAHVSVDRLVVSFAAIAGAVSVVAFGLIPAIRASRPDVMDLLRRAGRTSGLSGGRWVRNTVVTIEVALSFVLLVGSGLMIRSFVALQRADPGYDPRGVLTFFIPNLPVRQPDARHAFVRDLRARVEAMPGVVGVTAASPLPLDGRLGMARYGTEEALADPTKFGQATVHFVLPGYFETMKTTVIDGRTFTEADNRPESRAVIIDRVLAARIFPGQRAIGKTLLSRIRTQEPERFEIVGVVNHQRHTTLARDGREALFVPDGYGQHGIANRWAVRTTGDPRQLADGIRAAVTELNPQTAATEIRVMGEFMAEAQAQTKFALILIGVFAGVALVLAVVGLYSVLSTTVKQGTPEIGVRMAFGAAHGAIFRMMVIQGLQLSALGVALGMAAAFLLTGAMRTMLVGVKPTDPVTFLAMAAGFLVIAVVACGLPAWRASRLDPMVALRDE